MAEAAQSGAYGASTYEAPPKPMGDLFPFPDAPALIGADLDPSDAQLVRLRFEDGEEVVRHALMLRDCCACLSCRHPESLERTLDQLSYPLDVRPQSLAIVDGGELEIVWSGDAHVSRYSAGWLRAGGWCEALMPASAIEPWDRSFALRLPRFDYADVMGDDDALLAWLEALRDLGLTYVQGAPLEEGTVERLVSRAGFIRPSNFGHIFDVKAVVGAISNAYTANDLPLHVDLPAREYQPGYQFLHCITNEAEGGESVYADGFAMAEDLRAKDPDAFRTLTRTRVRLRYHDDDTDYVSMKPLIVTDEHDQVIEIRFSTSIMTSFDAPPEQMREVYRAYRALVQRTRDPAFQVELKMRPGDVACFDNRRVLHGRRAFAATTGLRHLQGAYMEREELVNRVRVLRRTR
jgi:gamma-butyrobetaine dioxygenase